jgi:hypothetical protein
MNVSLLYRPMSRRAALASSLAGLAFTAPDAMIALQATPDEPSSLEDFLRETEERRLRSLVEFDMDVAHALHAEDFQLINPAGAPLSKQEYLGGLESGFLDYITFEPISEIEVRVYGDGGALRYQSEIEIHLSDGFVDKGQFWHTDVYEMRVEQWQAVWSQATRIG